MSRAPRRKESLKKRVLTSSLVIWPGALLVSLIIRALYYSNRVRYAWQPSVLPYMRGEKPAVFCFWHGRMIMQLMIDPPSRRMHVLSSRHTDGTITMAIMSFFGVRTVRGSTNKGAPAALRSLMAVTRSGGNISITPDGPRGPFQKAAEGAAYLAARCDYALVPVTFSATRHWRFRSWDRLMIPKPFGRICFIAGEPIHLPADADDHAITHATALLEQGLIAATAEADALCGVAP